MQQVLVISTALRRAGHRVHVAVDGERGLQAARALKPDVIISDVMMPGISGFEVVASLRRISDLLFTPVLLLTSMSEMAHMREGLTSGADDYLTKPCAPDVLLRAMDAALARRGRLRETVGHVVSGAVGAAVEREKEALALRYEVRLTQEIGARWRQAAEGEGDIDYPAAVVVHAGWSGLGPNAQEAPAVAAQRLKSAYRAARDTLYLFGAERVISHPDAFVGIFSSPAGEGEPDCATRAANAAFALARHFRTAQPLAIGLHCGGVHLVAVGDPLHGESEHTLLPGETLATAAALSEAARSQQWGIAASRALTQMLQSRVGLGSSTWTGDSIEAVQLLSLRRVDTDDLRRKRPLAQMPESGEIP